MSKLLIMMLSILLISSYSFGGIPPETVKKAFEQKFPNATNVKWGKENAKEWEAEFVFNGSNVSANFAIDGKWLETESSVNIKDIPVAVTDGIKKQYIDWTIATAEKTESQRNGTIYEMTLKKGKATKKVEFKEDGSPVK